jgi:hypothetical protein
MGNPRGNPGNKGGRRSGHGTDVKIALFKNIAWDFVLEECQHKTNGKKNIAKYIKMFANKLMPQVIEGSGEKGAIVVEIKDAKYASIVQRESNALKSGAGSILAASSEESVD